MLFLQKFVARVGKKGSNHGGAVALWWHLVAPHPSYFSQEPSEQDIVFFNQHFVQCWKEDSCISWETYGMVQHFMNKGCEFPGRFAGHLSWSVEIILQHIFHLFRQCASPPWVWQP